VQYEVIASQAAPDAQRQWIEAFKASSPDNALAWFFSALAYFKAGERDRALQELMEAMQRPDFRAELAPTLQALEELNVSAGRAVDEAKVAAFQTCARLPHLPQMKDLAKELDKAAQEYRNAGDEASAQSVVSVGLVLGEHLSKGGGSQTLINQLVGIAIQRMFLGQLGSGATLDPLGRRAAELSAEIERHQKMLKDFAQMMGPMMSQLDDTEWMLYLERVKLYGEEAALTWLKEKHAQQ
jgi:tetratricopeptide (TPR) repeat protein